MKQHTVLYGAFAALFGAIGIYFGTQHVYATIPQPPAVRALFDSSLPDAKNQAQNLGKWKGKILLVNFWATWCTACVQEMPELSALQTEYKVANLQIIGIAIDSVDNTRDFSYKYKIGYPLYAAGMDGTELLRAFGDTAGGLPFSVLISPNGEVKKTYLGRLKIAQVKRDLAFF